MVRRVWFASALVAACAVGGGADSGDAGPDAIAPPKDAAADASGPADSGAADAPVADAPVETGSGVAVLQVNEVGPNIASSLDLVELLAKTSGDVGGITIEQDITTKVVLATLPTLVVSAGDVIIVHLNAGAGVTDESASKTDCADATCFSGAWDVIGGTTGITFSGRVLLARGPDAGIQDGVAFYNSSGTSPATFYQQVEALQDAGAWLPASCSGNPCSTNGLAQGISADWAGTGTTKAKSVARTTNQDTNTASDWAVGASSFGATNP